MPEKPSRSFFDQYPEIFDAIPGLTLCGWFRESISRRECWSLCEGQIRDSRLRPKSFQLTPGRWIAMDSR